MEQRSDEWFEARRKGITATDIVAIMGRSPWKSAFDVWSEKVNGYAAEDDESEALQWGREKEPIAKSLFCAIHPNVSIKEVGLITHPTNPLFVASPDGILSDNGLLEVKCPFNQHIPEEAPDYYVIQCQWQMFVTGSHRCYLFYWIPDGYRMFRIDADSEFQRNLSVAAQDFWDKHVVTKVEPEDSSNVVPIESIEDPAFRDEWNQLSQRYITLKDEIDASESELKTIRERLLNMAKGRKIKSPLVTASTVWSERKDYKGFCERNGYNVPNGTPSLSFRINKNKQRK